MTQGQRILAILSDGKRHSHHEFYGFCVLHSRISDLRKRGYEITCFKTGGTYEYQLVGAVREGEAVGADGLAADSALPHGPSDISGPSVSQTPESAETGSPDGPRSSLPFAGGHQLSVFEAAA